MTKFIYPLLLAIFFSLGCKEKCIQDSGKKSKNHRNLKDFDKLELSGAMKLILNQDNSNLIEITTDSSLMSRVKIKQRNGTLTLSTEDISYCGTDSIVIRLGIKNIEKIDADGAVKIASSSAIHVRDLELNASGSIKIQLELVASQLVVNLKGSNQLTLSGQAAKHKLSVEGTADVRAFDFVTGIYEVQVTGSAEAEINVLSSLTVETEGASRISYKGSPEDVHEAKFGSAVLKKVD